MIQISKAVAMKAENPSGNLLRLVLNFRSVLHDIPVQMDRISKCDFSGMKTDC